MSTMCLGTGNAVTASTRGRGGGASKRGVLMTAARLTMTGMSWTAVPAMVAGGKEGTPLKCKG
jgi:hypothetical protein